MAIPYHEIKILSQNVMDAALKAHPEHAERLRRADSHYEDGAYKHAIVHLIVQKDIDAAIKKIREERDVETNIARSAISTALENAPAAWKKDREFLHENAIEAVGKRYFILPPDLRKDTPFDTARKTLPVEAASVLDAAVKAVVTRKKVEGISYGPSTLDFMAAQLMPEGPEKEFRFAALHTTKPQGYEGQLTNSALAVRHFAAQARIEFSELKIALREGKEVPKKRTMPEKEPSLPALKATHNEARMPSPSLSLVHSEPPNEIMQSLRNQLKDLIAQESITREDALVYFYMFSMTKGQWPTYEHAAEKFSIAVEDVAEIVESVGKIMNAPAATPPEKLIIRR